MFLIQLTAKPTPQHEEHEVVGEAFVTCWIDLPSEQEALSAAMTGMRESHWEVQDVEEVGRVERDDVAEDCVEYFDQAKQDQEVYVFDVCPRNPVYYMRYLVENDEAQQVEAEIWIVNEALDTDRDPFAADFWSGELLELTQAVTRETLSEEGFAPLKLLDGRPCCRDDFLDTDRLQFYDEAEEHGLCICISEEEEDVTETS